MKLGFLSSILPDLTFEEVIDFAAETGYEAVELACWPSGKAERRYAGVTHIDCDDLDEEKVKYILDYCKDKNIVISALGYYPNNMDQDLEKRKIYNAHLLKVIDAAAKLGVNLVNTFIGRMIDKNVDDNLKILNSVWDPILDYANKRNVAIGIENCPMIFTYDEWPGGQNLGSSPHNLELIFKQLGDRNIGINYDPSHHIIQDMDYLLPFKQFRDKIYHLHLKDMKVDRDLLNQYGRMVPPNFYTIPKIPGHGDIDWYKFISAATEIGYKGCAIVEVEDRAYEGTLEDRLNSLRISYRYLRTLI
ncbi:sugar phosphate isomerase/epimerase family protein [Peptoniphilaceae bacterium SGI.131]